MLMLFILLVTPVMHPFWVHADPGSAAFSVDMIMFFKAGPSPLAPIPSTLRIWGLPGLATD
jgi:hypothetical protein